MNPSTEPIRLVLVDDQSLVRAGFRMVLDAQTDMTVVGEAGDGQAALDLLHTTAADVVLMDIRMPRMDGVAATEALCLRPNGPRVIVLTTFDLDEYAHAALRAGASGFLLKDAGPEDLLAAIRSVHGGDAVIAPSTTRRLIEHFADQPGPSPSPAASRPQDHPRLTDLTTREVEVLTAVARGLTNAEISAELYLAEATVKTHIGRILAKAHLRDRVQMVLLAYESGLVDVRPRS
ncbi:response regulator transcription factor [Janibacter cremeus]|uniref:DNA-binding NarL/FixJ family response regulator n=1 Tax=Janibacter cremeus TaxID=1285192 RepID=A0A852VL60_9MICO|nr:response regulator transcription factor [Janibacter cremeus]NYF96669.1 DNA-binding NarL/FixJ family response regulator [Janibacter cremeus]